MLLIGTIVDSLAIVAGCVIGLLIKKGLPERVSSTIMNGIVLTVLYIGISGSLEIKNTLIAIISMALGGLIGEVIDFDKRINQFGDFIQEKLTKGDGGGNISKAFVTSSLVFCVGAMSVVGGLESGLSGTNHTLFAKSVMDGVASIIFAASLGPGVLLSAVAVFVYQALITICAQSLSGILVTPVVTAMSGIGSLLIIGLALNMLGATKVKVANLLPAMFLPILFGVFNLL
ncbi:MAG: DUF554 domain-containing protein [Clostridioides sp.]|jgi:uncharacterized membrane protein YqgA involved in biofilm formation|nr:DUF554 domain-containing protein [Clostridioides sp.]